jgi:hypothetical protein
MEPIDILKRYILDNEFGNTYVRPQDALQAMVEYGKQFEKEISKLEIEYFELKNKYNECVRNTIM